MSITAGTVQPCSSDGWLEVVVIGNDYAPLVDAIVEIGLDDGARITRSKTDERGFVAFEALGKAPLTVRLAAVDASLWEVAARVELEQKQPGGRTPATIGSPMADEHDEAGAYDCADGDTVDAVAARFGVPRDALTDAEGAALDRAAPLGKGQSIQLPARRIRRDAAPSAHRHLIVRHDVPFWLVIRLRDTEHFRRFGVPYLLTLKRSDGSEAPAREGASDEDGEIAERIPFDAATGELLVGKGGKERTALRFQAFPPVTEPAGLRARLESLGFPCGGEEGEPGDATRSAISWFQYAVGLEATGETDDATRAALVAMNGA